VVITGGIVVVVDDVVVEDDDGLEPPTHWLSPHVRPGLHTLQAAPMLH
jgi:hypothetical protein